MRASTQHSGFIGRNTRLCVITFLMVKQRGITTLYHIAHCVKRSEKCPNLLNESSRVIRSGWPLVECITTSPYSDDSAKQWHDWFWVADRNCFWLVKMSYQNETKTTLVATASTVTSNVSSSCAYRTMLRCAGIWCASSACVHHSGTVWAQCDVHRILIILPPFSDSFHGIPNAMIILSFQYETLWQFDWHFSTS